MWAYTMNELTAEERDQIIDAGKETDVMDSSNKKILADNVKRIINEAIKHSLNINFQNCEFPEKIDSIDFVSKDINSTIDFTNAKFYQSVSFRNCRLFKPIIFTGAHFFDTVSFDDCTIMPCKFERCQFDKTVFFTNSKFCYSDETNENTIFDHSTFHETVRFTNSTFPTEMIFRYVLFKKLADFSFDENRVGDTKVTKHFNNIVFYHVILKSYIIIDLKTKRLTHADLGQMLLYVNYFDQEVKIESDNPTIGLILCTKKNNSMVKYLLGDKGKQVFASTYQFHLPTEKELEEEINREIKEIEYQLSKENKKT